MKKIILASCLLLLSLSAALAQGNQAIDPRITEVYGSYATQLTPDQMTWIQSQLQRSEIKKLPYTQGEQFTRLSQLRVETKFRPELTMETSFDPAHINPIKYNIDFFRKEDQTFRIDGTDYVLFVKKKD